LLGIWSTQDIVIRVILIGERGGGNSEAQHSLSVRILSVAERLKEQQL